MQIIDNRHTYVQLTPLTTHFEIVIHTQRRKQSISAFVYKMKLHRTVEYKFSTWICATEWMV